MRIGLDLRILGNKNGGIGRYSFEIAKHILELYSQNEYVLFVNEKNADPKDIVFFENLADTLKNDVITSRITVVKTGIRHYSFAEQTKFVTILNSYNLDLVHFMNFNVPMLYKKPFVVTVHDVVHHKISGAKKSRLLHFYAYKKIIESAVKKSIAIITVSEFSKKEIINYFHVPETKVHVTYEGITVPQRPQTEYIDEVKKRYVLTKPYFLFVGVLERKKNVVNLTRGFDVFIKKYGLDMDLVIVGKIDKHYPEIKHHALDIKNTNRLVFTGYVEDTELAGLYAGAFAYTSASLHEGFGLPGVEAMRYGLPLIVSNSEVFNEVYENASIYFDPLNVDDIAEKMYLLARDTQFYDQQRKKSQERGQFFEWTKTAVETLNIYKSTRIIYKSTKIYETTKPLV